MDSVCHSNFKYFCVIFWCCFQLLSYNLCYAEATAVYVFGDSLADVGNNNHLPFSLLKADFAHNGIDFPGHKATGRFSNGKNAADFLADKLGLPSSTPYLAIPSNSNKTYTFLKGVNFASGGAGLLDSTNSKQCISFSQQIDYYSVVYGSLVAQLGNNQAQNYLSKSIFGIIIGSNDIFNYVRSSSSNKQSNPPAQFVSSMIRSLQAQLQSLYNLGARKYAFVGTGPVGCCPSFRQKNNTEGCDTESNYLSVQYNKAAISLLQKMSSQLAGMSYSFFDAYTVLLEYINNPTAHGFTEVKAACCGLGGDLNAKIACIPISTYCGDRKNHIFWDLYHPTEATAGMLLNIAFDGSSPYVFPMNIRQLSSI